MESSFLRISVIAVFRSGAVAIDCCNGIAVCVCGAAGMAACCCGACCWVGVPCLNAFSTHLSLEFRFAAGDEWSMLIHLGFAALGAAPEGEFSRIAVLAILVRNVDVLTGFAGAAGAFGEGIGAAGLAFVVLPFREYLLLWLSSTILFFSCLFLSGFAGRWICYFHPFGQYHYLYLGNPCYVSAVGLAVFLYCTYPFI